MSISEFFTKTLGANLSNARWSWGASNANTSQLFLRVWDDQLEVINGVERISILRKDWDGSSAGFPERKRHVEALRNGVSGYGVLCTAKDIHAAGSRTIARFDTDNLLKFGNIFDDGKRVYAQVVARVPVKDLARQQTSHSSLVPDLKSILAKQVDATTKEALATARVGQGLFRTQVFAIWSGRCCVTGSKVKDAIRASHIKPWRDSSNQERLDPHNGLPLIATFDALFDAGLITFAADGKMLVSERLSQAERKLLGVSRRRLLKKPGKPTAEYLAYHHACIFTDGSK